MNGTAQWEGPTPYTGRGGAPFRRTGRPLHVQPASTATALSGGSGADRLGTSSGPGGDGLDLDPGPQREGGDTEGGPGREGLAGEVAGVDLVDGGEVGDIGE